MRVHDFLHWRLRNLQRLFVEIWKKYFPALGNGFWIGSHKFDHVRSPHFYWCKIGCKNWLKCLWKNNFVYIYNLINEIKFELFTHAHYSPDLASSDYFRLSNLKKELCGIQFVRKSGSSQKATMLRNKDIFSHFFVFVRPFVRSGPYGTTLVTFPSFPTYSNS